MLTVRATSSGLWRLPAFDVLSDGAPIGQIAFGESSRFGVIRLRDKPYTVSPTEKREGIGWFLRRNIMDDKAEPCELKDASGAVLATATPAGPGFRVALGRETVEFRRVGLSEALPLGIPAGSWILQPSVGGEPLGAVAKQHGLDRSINLLVPERFDDAQKCFLFWLRAKSEMERTARESSDLS
jgi:hypothetical protein